ncbi:MAG: GH36-type glycosyl hydrolase domain-containing protein, partial [Spirochaetota bacterium]
LAAFYVKKTGDTGILDAEANFIQGRQLSRGEESYYDMPGISDEKATVYDHCVRSLKHALETGVHGLPLMGCGDWNDGMNLVGAEGRGESVWLAFFLYSVLIDFYDIALLRGDTVCAGMCKEKSSELKRNIDETAWDGKWFLRGFYDDGSALGSSQNDECRIDSITQSWAVISGAADRKKADTALDSLFSMLVHRDNGIIHLLDPPFDVSAQEPGYIKGYPPGIRENGGQYTHAAVWAVMAFAKNARSDKMKDLLHMINPVNHGSTADKIGTYMVEPYVMSADIYGTAPHTGRGGWTWYTGSAAWMYRLTIESVFGIEKNNNVLAFSPCFPDEWKECVMHYRFHETMYHLSFEILGKGHAERVTVDGAISAECVLRLIDDRKEHFVKIEIGKNNFNTDK